MQKDPLEGCRIGSYRIRRFIAKGAYGFVYEVTDETNQRFALKMESRVATTKNLKMDAHVLRRLRTLDSSYFCRLVDTARTDGYNLVVMELSGPSLADVNIAEKRLSISSIMLIGVHCVNSIQLLHSVGIVHRDIKPANICLQAPLTVKLIDFGMSRSYLDAHGLIRHPRWFTQFKGTLRYAGVRVHESREYSRGDDLESLVYLLIELMVGTLPWTKSSEEEDAALVYYQKQKARTTGLCELLSGCPKQFVHLLMLLDSLGYYDAPDYGAVRGLMREAMDGGEKEGEEQLKLIISRVQGKIN